MEKFISIVYEIFRWMVKLCFLNILWFVFSIGGLIILGIAPATSAMFSVARKWLMGEHDIGIFYVFWENYRNNFIRSNIIGLILAIVGFILYLDLLFLVSMDGLMLWLLTVGSMTLLLIYLIAAFFIFPVFVHYEMSLLQYFRYAIIIGISYPHITLFMIVAVCALYLIISAFPGYLPFFSASTLSFSMMWLALYVFKKVEPVKS